MYVSAAGVVPHALCRHFQDVCVLRFQIVAVRAAGGVVGLPTFPIGGRHRLLTEDRPAHEADPQIFATGALFTRRRLDRMLLEAATRARCVAPAPQTVPAEAVPTENSQWSAAAQLRLSACIERLEAHGAVRIGHQEELPPMFGLTQSI